MWLVCEPHQLRTMRFLRHRILRGLLSIRLTPQLSLHNSPRRVDKARSAYPPIRMVDTARCAIIHPTEFHFSLRCPRSKTAGNYKFNEKRRLSVPCRVKTRPTTTLRKMVTEPNISWQSASVNISPIAYSSGSAPTSVRRYPAPSKLISISSQLSSNSATLLSSISRRAFRLAMMSLLQSA